ncbi:MAG: XdhC/CoxI family protein [Anaerolineales bacterium]|nr:XdhC/CoxI family protein [Anaerolineales bacterium]
MTEQASTIWSALAELEQCNESGALCILVRSRGSTPRHTSSKMLVYPDGRILGTVGGGELERRVIAAAVQAIADGKPRLLEYSMSDPARGDPGVCGGQMEVYVEPILPKPTLVVVGSGHVGKAVAWLAHWLGFRVAVNDDRAEFCTPEAVPGGDDFYPCALQELPARLRITSSTYLALTTRGADVDIAGLPALLDTPAAYIGVIGSRRRWAHTRKALIQAGVPEDRLARVHSPLGLELHAETPEEIAVSILAEIIALRNGAAIANQPEKSGAGGEA